MKRFGTLVLLGAVVAACGSTPAAPTGTGSVVADATAAPTASVPAVGGTTPTTAPPSVQAVVPGDVTLADIGGNAPVAGVAHFTAQGADEVAISVDLDGTAELLPFPDTVTVAAVAGTCAGIAQPAIGSSADVGHQTVHVESGKGKEPLVVSLATITASPHAVLVATAAGDFNLACGDIGG